jgi:septum formation protein
MRELSAAEITHYVELDRPLDCAGSFKWESLGITLFEGMHTNDPTALEGLPLIALGELLREAGISLPLAAQPGQH